MFLLTKNTEIPQTTEISLVKINNSICFVHTCEKCLVHRMKWSEHTYFYNKSSFSTPDKTSWENFTKCLLGDTKTFLQWFRYFYWPLVLQALVEKNKLSESVKIKLLSTLLLSSELSHFCSSSRTRGLLEALAWSVSASPCKADAAGPGCSCALHFTACAA